MSTTSQHDADILDQFTRQAVPFSKLHASDDELMDLLVEASGVGHQDRVLDIACGPGLVSCAFAAKASHVTGIDMVPAMLDHARVTQKQKGFANIDWKQGSAMELPFPEGEFDLVVTRFSFHHYLDPETAIREMKRVCKPGGAVMVVDVAPQPSCRDSYDEVERLRDPSHTSALTEMEFKALGNKADMKLVRKMTYELEAEVESLLASSFPRAGDGDKVRALFERDIELGGGCLDVGSHRRDRLIYFFFPVLALVWRKE